MAAFLYTWNPKRWNWLDLQDAIYHVNNNKPYDMRWIGQVYGDFGKNYIEVHHLRQIADIGEEYEIKPIEDLRPVCANCHRMLHKERPPPAIEELKTKLVINRITDDK